MKSLSMYKVQSVLIAVLAAMVFTACEHNSPVDPEPTDTIPAYFPKKHLIEEFTGQGCGYCPNGMDCIRDFVAADTNWVLLLHHYGYGEDHFSVAPSEIIKDELKVSGAPQIAINREKTTYTGTKKAVVFHPGYLQNTKKSQFEETTYASVVIENTYDAATRTLDVHISGAVCTPDVPELMLTVVIKESGMIDVQSDYYGTYEGWQEFRHCNAARAFLTPAKGDTMKIEKQRYSADYTMTLDSKWVPENCMVVAFLSEAFKPVVQAEQRPVVAGTKGGADIQHGGITPVPVPDFYPEPNATDGPAAFSGNKSETMTSAAAWYTQYAEVTMWQIQTYSTANTVVIDNTQCVPFAFLYLFTEAGTTTLSTGTYTIDGTYQPGTMLAGYRDDAEVEINGSMFYFTDYSYLQQGYLNPLAQWLIADGEMTVDENGWSITGHTFNGASISLTGTTPISNQGKASAPAKMPKKEPRTCVNEKKAVPLHEIWINR